MVENSAEDIQIKLEKLKIEHRDLDEVLDRLTDDRNIDELQIKRMKKRKLYLKDTIAMLENQAVRDIPA